MAFGNANGYDYRLVEDETHLQDAIAELKRKIEIRNTLLAVDCEGDSLSRKGALTIITVATEEKVYIFDVLKLGQLVFSSGLIGVRAGGAGGAAAPPVSKIFGQNAKNSGNKETINDGIGK